MAIPLKGSAKSSYLRAAAEQSNTTHSGEEFPNRGDDCLLAVDDAVEQQVGREPHAVLDPIKVPEWDIIFN